MLQALETGVKVGQWFSLIDKVWKKENLGAAWMKAFANEGSAGVDGQSIQQFTARLSQELEKRRTQGKSIKEVIGSLMPVMRGWFE